MLRVASGNGRRDVAADSEDFPMAHLIEVVVINIDIGVSGVE